jgi:hypothetical protein
MVSHHEFVFCLTGLVEPFQRAEFIPGPNEREPDTGKVTFIDMETLIKVLGEIVCGCSTVQVECPLSKMLGARSFSDLGVNAYIQ